MSEGDDFSPTAGPGAHRNMLASLRTRAYPDRMRDQGCLFCRIAAREIPAAIVHEDDRVVAFRDIGPQAPVHVLVVPREHVASLDATDERHQALLGALLLAARQIARDEGLAADGYRTVINTGAGAGQTVHHLHVHLLGGRTLTWPPG